MSLRVGYRVDIFSGAWMESFKDQWNKEPDLINELAHIKFDSVIGYGFKAEAKPRGVIRVAKGEVTSAGDFEDETLNWDLRADKESWQDWIENPPGMMALGMAYTSQKLRFIKGDYASMIKDPSIAGPFIKSFIVMSRVKV